LFLHCSVLGASSSLLQTMDYNSTVDAKSSLRDGLAITCILQTSNSVVLMPFNKWRTLEESANAATVATRRK
jgi:hypothetical protein